MAGSDVESVATVARTGAEFVAVCQAVFAADADPADRIAEANAILEREAPRF
jgi:thiamine-phosphate pyrophosphorylase